MELMMTSTNFRVNSPTIAHESIDGETMVIDFETGTYHNLQGSATVVWEQIIEGATLDDIVAAVARAYRGDPAEIRAAVTDFVDELLRENLIIADAGTAPGPIAAPGTMPQADAPPADQPAFAAPKLITFTDMQDFLLADPIHEYDEAGFPKPKEERAGHA
jgi:hypothetical protein